MSVAEPIDSGRFETKIATSSPTLTPSPVARPMPSTSCSGMPSRNAPSASAGPAAADARRSITGRPRSRRARRPRARARSCRGRRGRALLDEVEADRADQRARAEREHAADQPVRPVRASPSSAPMTSDDAASAPYPSAAPMAGHCRVTSGGLRRVGSARMGVLDLFRLDGKVAIVTGASSGLGVAFAKAWPRPARTSRSARAASSAGARRRQLVEAAGRRAIAVATDVSKPEDCQALVDADGRASSGASTSSSTTPASAPPYPATRESPTSSARSSTST